MLVSNESLGAGDTSPAILERDFVLSPDQITDLNFFQTILEFLYSVTDLIISFFT